MSFRNLAAHQQGLIPRYIYDIRESPGRFGELGGIDVEVFYDQRIAVGAGVLKIRNLRALLLYNCKECGEWAQDS